MFHHIGSFGHGGGAVVFFVIGGVLLLLAVSGLSKQS